MFYKLKLKLWPGMMSVSFRARERGTGPKFCREICSMSHRYGHGQRLPVDFEMKFSTRKTIPPSTKKM